MTILHKARFVLHTHTSKLLTFSLARCNRHTKQIGTERFFDMDSLCPLETFSHRC